VEGHGDGAQFWRDWSMIVNSLKPRNFPLWVWCSAMPGRRRASAPVGPRPGRCCRRSGAAEARGSRAARGRRTAIMKRPLRQERRPRGLHEYSPLWGPPVVRVGHCPVARLVWLSATVGVGEVLLNKLLPPCDGHVVEVVPVMVRKEDQGDTCLAVAQPGTVGQGHLVR
jgi:hypothetical protein